MLYVMLVNNLLSHIPRAFPLALHQHLCGYEVTAGKSSCPTMAAGGHKAQRWWQALASQLPSRVGKKPKRRKERKGMRKLPSGGSGKRSNGSLRKEPPQGTGSPQKAFPMVDTWFASGPPPSSQQFLSMQGYQGGWEHALTGGGCCTLRF